MPITVHPLLDQPQRALAPQAGLGEIVRRAQPFVGARVQQHDVERLRADSRSARALACRSATVMKLARRLVPHVEHHARRKAPLERHLVDRARPAGPRTSGRNDTGASTCVPVCVIACDFLDGPAQPAANRPGLRA